MLGSLVLAGLLAGAPPPAGTYRITRDQVSAQKKVWGLFCGRAPDQVERSLGATVTVSVEGEEWTAKGAGRRFGTATCEGTNPTLAPVDRRRDGEWIVFVCKSQRVTRGTEQTEHRVRVTEGGALEFRSKGENEFRKDGDLCRSSFERVTLAVPHEVKAAAKAPSAPPPDPCATPAAPTELRLSPKVFDAKVGGKPVCLEAAAFDANACAAAAEGLSFVVEPAGAGKVDAKGCFSPSASLKEEEAVAIIARLSGVEAVATARVVPAAEERAKKTLQTLAKTARSKRAREVLGEVSRGEITLRPLESAPPELPPLEAEPFPIVPVAGAGGAALLATALGVVLALRRRKRQVEPTELQAAPVVTPKKGGGLVCPKCSFEFAVGEATECPFDNEVLVPLGRDARQTMFVPAAGGMICPVCYTRYPTKARFCGHDRAPLLPDFGQFADKKSEHESEEA